MLPSALLKYPNLDEYLILELYAHLTHQAIITCQVYAVGCDIFSYSSPHMCHVMLCHVMSCHVMSCHTIPYDIIPHNMMTHRITLLTCNAVLQRIVRTTLTWRTPLSSHRHCCHPAVSIVLDKAHALPALQTILCVHEYEYVLEDENVHKDEYAHVCVYVHVSAYIKVHLFVEGV
jgi:hypothetical protein